MKCLAFLAIIIFGLAQQPAKTSVPEKTNAAVQTEAALHADQKPSGEDLKVQHQLARFTGLLVLVGFLQLIALVGQACLFFRQARIMGQHRVSLEQLAEAASDNAKAAKDGAEAASKNAEFSKLNALATEKSVDAANASAQAAKENVEMFISKERGRLRVEVQDLVIPGQPFDAVRYQIKFYGATDAFIVSSGAEAFVQTSAEPPPKSSDNMILPISPLTKIFTRATSARTQFTLIEAREVRNGRRLSLRLSQDDINNITHNKSFVHFRGFIKYRDIFEKTLSKTIASDPHKHWFGAPTLEMLEKCSFLTQIVP
jgi:hypothetical protein